MPDPVSKIQFVPFYDAFISYSHSDEKFVEKLATDLAANKFDVFFDKWCITYGQNISNTIKSALNNCNKIIAVISQKYLMSDWATFERDFHWSEIHLHHSTKLIPIIIESCELPNEINQLLYIDFKKGKKVYDEKLTELKRAIRNINELKFGPYQIYRVKKNEDIYIEHICKKIDFYFNGHRLNILRLAYNELVNNGFEHSKSLHIHLTITSTQDYIKIEVQDSGKGFDIIKTLQKKREELTKNPLLIKGRGLILLVNDCDYIDNIIDKSSHTVSAVIGLEKRINQVFTFNEYKASNLLIVTFFSMEDKTLFFCVNSDRINVINKELIKSALVYSINPQIKKYIIELRNTVSADSSGMSLFITFMRILRNIVGIEFKLILVINDEIHQLFKVSQLDLIFSICSNLESAISQINSKKTLNPYTDLGTQPKS